PGSRFGRNLMISPKPIRPIGRLIRNIQCQLAKVVMNPPTGGPIVGATRAGTVNHVMAARRSERATERKRMSLASGVIIAPPIPLKKRASTNSDRELEKAQAIEP